MVRPDAVLQPLLVHAGLRVPQAGRADDWSLRELRMKVTEEMVDRACRYVPPPGASRGGWRYVEALLNAGLADVPEPEPGPFTVSEDERGALMVLMQDATAKNDAKEANTVAAMFDRAVRTLAAPAVEPLSEGDELYVGQCEDMVRDSFPSHITNVSRLVGIIRKRFPKPKPARKTAQQLWRSFSHHKLAGDELEALAELVRRAEELEK